MKKRFLSLALALLLALSLCACGSPSEPAPAPEASASPVPAEPTPTPGADTPEARRELALSFVNKDAAALIEALGEPLERTYVPSCLGSGQDGELRYEGFTVYTYREGDRETVKDVI